MKFTPNLGESSTITLAVPEQATFAQLADLTELPECMLEVTEVRVLADTYLDTAGAALTARQSTLRLATVGIHHFLIYEQRQRSGTQLASTHEHVERLTIAEHAVQLAGDRSHPLYQTVAADAPGPLREQLTRRSTFRSTLFRVGESRFELGLETVRYERAGRFVSDELVALQLIEGDPDVVRAIAAYLKAEYQLTVTAESPLARGQRLTS